ncbi:MAG: dTDP-4-dehydrorhamnose 3,5-epimerase [Niastella sp. SCN 39-18]|nr:dTDP-4-dehydrorhamnose 3,5-epimerase [Sphingobacteriales bacterium]ODT52051.1 MAG: dTDP-4-dehydrorhamnose 3,5-epimerase [Niastella sp. SCN 39-18]OJW11011.1 MAG: dTDP-4-dehydrorhamnose 3,5-epimerase [Sphingobacteriales bacterium 39-19]
MIFTETILKGSYVIDPVILGDNRGWFMRTFCKEEFAAIQHTKEWVQMNQSFTRQKGTIRGMHFQHAPHAEIKLVRCIAGAIFDVIIDMRKNSKTYLQWVGTTLSAENKKSFYIPEGFAHGFQTLADNTEIVYAHTGFYNAEFESGVLYNDPKVNIQWPLPVTELSVRDRNHAPIKD